MDGCMERWFDVIWHYCQSHCSLGWCRCACGAVAPRPEADR